MIDGGEVPPHFPPEGDVLLLLLCLINAGLPHHQHDEGLRLLLHILLTFPKKILSSNTEEILSFSTSKEKNSFASSPS